MKRWWTSQCTADVAFDDEFLSLAARSGCKALFLGLETISQASLNVANKRHNRAGEYREVIRRFHAHGIAVQAGVVFGFDHDDRSIFRTTVEFYRSAGLDSATVSVLIPFPNTPLFKRLDAEGRILTRDWSKYNGKKDVVFQPALMSPHELLMGMEWAARQFYSSRFHRRAHGPLPNRPLVEHPAQHRLPSRLAQFRQRGIQSGKDCTLLPPMTQTSRIHTSTNETVLSPEAPL